MATVIQRLSTLGLPTDYQSRKRLYEESGLGGQYGDFKGTAQQNLAFASWAESNKRPSPQSISAPSVQGSGWNIDTSGFNDLQKQFISLAQSQPSQSELYTKWSTELGIPAQTDIVSGLNKSILDLEKKISDVEPMVASRTKDFLVTEAQRSKIQTEEEKPLREQYLESLRRKEYEEAGLSSKQQLLSQRLKYAAEESARPLSLLGQMIDWQTAAEEAKKKEAGVNIDLSGLFPGVTGQTGGAEDKPTFTPDQYYNTLMDEVLGKGQTGTLNTQSSAGSTTLKKKTTYPTSQLYPTSPRYIKEQ